MTLGALPTPFPAERAPSIVRLLAVSFDIVVVARVVVPVVVNIPVFVVLAEIVFVKMSPKYPSVALSTEEKKFVLVLFVLLEFVVFVVEALTVVADKLAAPRFVVLKFAIVALFNIKLSNVVVETIPFTLLVMRDPALVSVLLFTVVVVETDPPTLEVKTFPVEDKVLATWKFVTDKFEIVVVARVLVPVTLSVPVAAMFVPVAFPKRKFVIDPVRPFSNVEKNEVDVAADRVVVARVDVPVTVTSLAVRVLVELMFPAVKVVPVELVNTSFVMVALVAVRLVKKAVIPLTRFEKNEVVVALVMVALVPNSEEAVIPVAEALERVV